MWPLIYRIKVSPKRYVSKQMKGSYNKIHGYTVQQQYPTLYYPTNANNVKNVELLKHFKIRKLLQHVSVYKETIIREPQSLLS